MKGLFILCGVVALTGAALALAPLLDPSGSNDRPSPSAVEILNTDSGDVVARKFIQLQCRGLSKELRDFGPRISAREFKDRGNHGAQELAKHTAPVLSSAEMALSKMVAHLNQAIVDAKSPEAEEAAVLRLREFNDDAAREFERLGR